MESCLHEHERFPKCRNVWTSSCSKQNWDDNFLFNIPTVYFVKYFTEHCFAITNNLSIYPIDYNNELLME